MPKNKIKDKKFRVVYRKDNETHKGYVMADDQKSAITKINKMGYSLISISEVQTKKIKSFKQYNKNAT